MADYRRVFYLIDKVSAPLKKIAENTRKTNEKTSKLKSKMTELSNKLKSVGLTCQSVGAKIKNFGRTMSGVMSKIGIGIGAFTGAVGLAFSRAKGYIDQFVEKADHIDKASQKIGMSRKTYQELDFIMQQNGGNVDSLMQGYKTLASQMTKIQTKGKGNVNVFKQLGVQTKKNNGLFRSQEEVFWDTVEALRNIKDTTQRAALGNQLFGRGFIELKPLLNNTTEEFKELRKQAQQTIISDEIIKSATKYKDTMNLLSLTFQAKLAPAFAKVMPKILEITDKLTKTDLIEKVITLVITLTEKIVNIVDWFMNLSKGQKMAIAGFVGVLAAIGPVVTALGSVITLLGTLAGAFGVATGVVAGAFATWTVAIGGIIAGIWALVKAIQILLKMGDALKRLNTKVTKDVDAGGLTQDQLQRLSGEQVRLGKKEFAKTYGKDVQKAVQKYEQNNNTTNNNTQINNYYGNSYSNSGATAGSGVYVPAG